ncbi:MAG: signal peptide peptidase SppA [Candidatus Buchananbacteria bacterium]|nr:signal peptide peptidase SppA [Candidatus Buchananbacteria bacterium]
MKFHLPPKIKKISKAISVIILIVTVIAFWSIAVIMWFDDDSLVYGDCNVAKINLYGDLYTYIQENEECADCSSSEEIVNQIKDADANENIKAILLSIDSGGGWPTTGQEIANALKRSEKPTVALIRDMGASAAYFAASGADRIFASDLSDVGSIGITMSYLDNVNKNQKEGLTFNQLSIGKYKDTGNSDKKLTKEEKDMLIANLQTGYDIFVRNVAENRKLDIEKVKQLADGNSMDGQKALDNGLIDQLGDSFDVEKYLSDVIGEEAVVCR